MKSRLTILSDVFFLDLMLASQSFAKYSMQTLVQVPWPVMQVQMDENINKIIKQSEQSPIQVPGFSTEYQDIKIQFLGFRISLIDADDSNNESKYPSGTTVSQNEINWISPRSKLHIEILGIEIAGTKVIPFGGGVINVTIRAQCAPFVVRQNDFQFGLNALFGFRGTSLSSWYSNINYLNSPSRSLEIDPIQCQGLEGLDDSLHQEIKSRLSSDIYIKELLNSFLNNQLNLQLKGFVVQFIESVQNQLSQGSKIMEILEVDQGFLLRVNIKDHPQEAEPNPYLIRDIDTQMNPDSIAMIFPGRELIESLTQNWSSSENKVSLALHEISEFKKLMSSRLLQMFLWIDLWSYKKTSPFYLDLKASSDISILPFHGGLRANYRSGIELRSFKKNKWWNYLEGSASVSSEVKPILNNQELQFAINSKISNLQIDYTQEYLSAFSNPGILPRSQIHKWIKLNNVPSDFRYPLPEFKLIGSSYPSFKADQVEMGDNGRTIIFWKSK